MEVSLILLLVAAIIWLLLVILYFVRVAPFNYTYFAPDPRDWQVKSEEQQVTTEINYEPYLYDQPQQPAEQIYRHFINYYCELGPTGLGNLYEDKLCNPFPLDLWITYGDDPVATTDADMSGIITVPSILQGARPFMIANSTLAARQKLLARAAANRRWLL